MSKKGYASAGVDFYKIQEAGLIFQLFFYKYYDRKNFPYLQIGHYALFMTL
jgi:hypothetical protein